MENCKQTGSLLLESSEAFDLVFDLIRSVALMVQDFADFEVVHTKVRMGEVDKAENSER